MTEQTVVGRIASFDPLQQDEGDFIASFVARERELQLLIRFVAEAQTQVLTNHPLIYGPRGMGKTTLLRRLALAVRDNAAHSDQWIPITFREEQYNVTRIDDFYINCADGLANWCEQNGDQKSAVELDDAIDRRDQLQACLGTVAKRHNRRLLLLVDNIQYIFSALKQPSDHWQMREWLQQRNGPLMIAATPIVIEQLGNRDEPFYDFFQLVNLKPLSAADLKQCLVKIAQSRGIAGNSVVAELKKHPQRIVTLHTLCGGNPRTLSLIYQVLENLCREDAVDSGSVFADLLEGTLEKTTPLYKARTEELSDQQRPILDAIALHWDPIHSSTISQRTGVAPSALSSQLKRLTTDGVIDRVKLGEKKYGYQLGERFYNIWYLMRHGSRRNRERLRWLIQFLNSYYTPAELNRQARQQLGVDPQRTPFTESLMYAIDDTSLSSALRQHLTLPLIDSNADVIRHLTPDEDYSASILDHHQRRQKIVDKLLAMGRSVEQSNLFADQVSSSMSLETLAKQRISETELSTLQIDGLTSVFTAEEVKLRELIGDTFYNSITTLFANGMITGIDDEAGIAATVASSNNLGKIVMLLTVCFQGGNVSSKHLQMLEEKLSILLPVSDGEETVEHGYSELDALTCYHLGNLLANQLQRYNEAEQAYKKAVEVDPVLAYPWYGLGNLLADQLQRYDEAEQAYKKAIEVDPSYALPWNNLGNLLTDQLQRYEEAEQAYKNAIEVDPNYALPWNNLGNLLAGQLQRYDEAEQAYIKAIEVDPVYAYPWNGLGYLLAGQLERYEEAEQAYKKAIEVDPGFAYPWNGLGNLLADQLQRYEEAEQAYKKAIEVDPNYAEPWTGLGNLMQDHRERFSEAEDCYAAAAKIANPDSMQFVSANRIWLALARGDEQQYQRYRRDLSLPEPGLRLIEAGKSIIDGNPGAACSKLQSILEENEPALWFNFQDDLLRLTRLIKQNGFGNFYLGWIREQRLDQKLSPYTAAVEAYFVDPDALLRLNPEARGVAIRLYHWLISKPADNA